MKVFPIEDPVAGEQLLSVQPVIERHPQADWSQRLQYFTGRALTHTALALEQRNRSGHLATLGQALSPGVVTGLEASAIASADGVVIEIAAGMGITRSGETVHINRNQQVLLDDIRVYAPASLLDADWDSSQGAGAGKLGDTLAALRAAARPLPEALVLVLQPVVVEHFSQPDSSDPCDYDPTDEAFENWQWLDACRLVLYAWPAHLGPVPAAGKWRRNRIAHAVFDYERGLDEGEFVPWSALGLPIALTGLNAALEFDFLDRNTVRRRGGESLGNDVPISPAGDRFLWQARFEQFNEQLVDWLLDEPGLDPADIAASAQFRQLPPVGILPRESMEPRLQKQAFFPLAYAVRALALPYEQLDLAIEESAALAPYDLNGADQVEVLVPVPQQHYEPQLLVVETLDPEFDLIITRMAAVRDQWLGRRLVVRNKASTLYHAITGKPLLYRKDDPDALDSLERPLAFARRWVTVGDSARYFRGRSEPPGNWFQASFDEGDWETGATDIGYGRGNLGTSLTDMKDQYVTIYLRHSFTLDELEQARRYTLAVATNGGFYAYLNGKFLASDNVSRPGHTEPAQQAQALETRFFELGALAAHLVDGDNVLAIQAHNSAVGAAEFSISVELLDTEDSFGTREVSAGRVSPPFGQEQYEVAVLAELRGYLDASTPLSDAEVARLDEIGIEAYIDYLQEKIDRADDRVEFGFLRLRTDIYRIRQVMLGNEAGTKLATSPALAEIAKGDSAVATRDELTGFYERIKRTSGGDEIGGDESGGEGGGDSAAAGRGAAAANTNAINTNAPNAANARASSSRNSFLSSELSSAATDAIAGRGGDRSRLIDSGRSALDDRNARVIDGAIPGARKDVLAGRDSSNARLFKTPTAGEVGGQNPIIGNVQIFNNATVGERLQESSANVGYMSGVAVKGELIGNLLETDINIDDLSVPGLVSAEGKNTTFADMRADGSILGKILAGDFDVLDGDDEAAYFNAGVKAMENVAGVLRLIEGRVHAYRRAVTRCRSSIAAIKNELDQADLRLATIGAELAEARHDVSVARALKAEEAARIQTVNDRRDKVLATQVPFLLYRRPRRVDPRRDVPLHYLNPDLTDQPLPLCDLAEVEAPESLEAMLDVVRDAPLRWFQAVKLIMPQLSRLADLHVTLSGARKRAASRLTVHPFLNTNFQVPDKLLRGLGATLSRSQQRVQVQRRKTSLIELVQFQRLGWRESIQRVPEVVSLGDLIDGNHGRMAASRRAANEMDMIARVATCLYVGICEIPALIRLDWAERFSQFDTAADLRNLYSLPRFGELEYSDRVAMQRLVDWLYGRIDSQYSDAHDMISDLVRVAILTASYAPVNQLIAAHLPEPVRVQVGSRVRVVADLSRVRVGMAVSMNVAGAAAVRGRVADISGGEVTAEVHTLAGASVQLESGTRVQIGERLGMMFTT
jgi:hypothetical protein